jgi:MOSC domain-containing protein YiiM
MAMSESIKLLSIQVGCPRLVACGGDERTASERWESAIWKVPVAGPVWVTRTNVVGDHQVAPQHGGPEMAVLAYGAEHYDRWRTEMGRDDIGPGGFGENFTIAGLDEEIVCLGDIYTVGSVRLQVAQPRTPCWKLERRWNQPGLVERVLATGRHGWFFRVLTEGEVVAGQRLRRIDRPLPAWPIARVAAIKHRRQHDPDAAAELAACELLAPDCRAALAKLA